MDVTLGMECVGREAIDRFLCFVLYIKCIHEQIIEIILRKMFKKVKKKKFIREHCRLPARLMFPHLVATLDNSSIRLRERAVVANTVPTIWRKSLQRMTSARTYLNWHKRRKYKLISLCHQLGLC